MADNSDLPISMADLIRNAETGDMESQYSLGWELNQTGKTESDMDDAVKWLRLSAKQGFAKAQCYLGKSLVTI